MPLTNRTVQTKHIRARCTRLAATTLAALLFCAAFLAAQTAPELKLVVTGDVPTPLTLTAKDLAAMPRESAAVDDPDGGKTTYEGVPLQEILKKAGIPFGRQMRGKDLAGYVLAEAKDGYAVVFSLGELDPDLGGARVLVADKRDGKPLFEYQGPVRLVLPADKAGARSVRMLEKLEVVKLRK
jgi:DMSO/TMAO reductase YedYZ molybdopterin-dependent catalytic subunit